MMVLLSTSLKFALARLFFFFFGKKKSKFVKKSVFFQKGSKTEKWLFFDLKIISKSIKIMFFVYKRVLGLLNQCFDKLDQKKIKKYIYLSYLQIFISTESMCHARSTSNIKTYNTKKSKKNSKKNSKNQ